MRNYFLPVLLCLIFSCKSNTKQPTEDSLFKDTSLTVNNSKSTNLLIEKFKPLLQGIWVKKAYIDKIAKTKSPLAAVDEALDITTFSINTMDIKGDGIIVPIGSANHDGSNLTLSFKKGKRPSSLIIGAGELSVAVDHSDTTITLYYPDDKNQVKAAKFIRVNSKKVMQIADGMYRMVNKVLIAGIYNIMDTTANATVIFNIDGKVKGFSSFKNYVINIDLNSDTMDNLDEIWFDDDTKNRKSYSFRFDADTLKLYDTRPNTDSTLLVLDKLRYKLVRQK